MTTTENKVTNIFTYLAPTLISNVLPLVILPVITRFLSPKDFGIWALATSSTLIIVNLFGCNVNAATQRYYFEYRKNKKDLAGLINTGFIFLLISMLFSIPIIYILKGFISKIVLGDVKYGSAILFAYIGGWFSILVNYYLMLYRNMEKAKYFSAFTTLQVVINSVLSLILIVGFKFDYMGLIYSNLISFLIPLIALIYLFMTNHRISFNKKILIDDLKYGIPLLPNLFTSSIYQFFDKYMIRSIVSISSTGVYSIAKSISNKIFVVMTAVQATYDPIFMKDMFDRGVEGARSVGRNFTVFSYISLSAVLVAILFGEEIISIFAPPSYRGAINMFLILVSTVSVQTFGKIVGSQLAYVKKAYLSFPISVVGLTVNVLLNLLLIPVWGAFGAAIATLVTTVTMNIIYFIIAQKYYRIVYENKILISISLNSFLSFTNDSFFIAPGFNI